MGLENVLRGVGNFRLEVDEIFFFLLVAINNT